MGWHLAWIQGLWLPIPTHPIGAKGCALTGVPRGPCATSGPPSASSTSVDLLWGEGLRLLVLAGCGTPLC